MFAPQMPFHFATFTALISHEAQELSAPFLKFVWLVFLAGVWVHSSLTGALTVSRYAVGGPWKLRRCCQLQLVQCKRIDGTEQLEWWV